MPLSLWASMGVSVKGTFSYLNLCCDCWFGPHNKPRYVMLHVAGGVVAKCICVLCLPSGIFDVLNLLCIVGVVPMKF